MSWEDEMLEFEKGWAYAYAPHNLHPLSPIGASIDFINDPTDPYAAGYLTGSLLTNIPVRTGGSYASFSTLVWMLTTKVSTPALAVPMAASAAIDLQVRAGKHIASGGTKGKDMYTGSRRYEESAKTLGYTLSYQPGGGGMQI
ncbi:MAG: hypothetical protein [Circular genetic element sp.]|nr:MAG: hypothetical protein [Circular genetic element sp.]